MLCADVSAILFNVINGVIRPENTYPIKRNNAAFTIRYDGCVLSLFVLFASLLIARLIAKDRTLTVSSNTINIIICCFIKLKV